MIPQTGTYAYYSFTSRFKLLNGIYTVVKVESYQEALSEGTDFGNSLYIPAGLSSEDFSSDGSLYNGLDVYFLQSTDGKTIYPCPSSIIAKEPDLAVGKYDNLYMTIYLGYWDDPNKLSWLTAMINDITSASTGSATNAVIRMAEPNTIWMRSNEYRDMDQQRQQAVKKLMPLTLQIQQLQAQVNQLKSENNYLKSLIISADVSNKT